ncbi:ATP-binding protein [Vibrio splendidus]|nr:ATP-binding protein [Vibrio splendidus]MCC4880385.1 ATP-binding protein [Vibrio splendidus]
MTEANKNLIKIAESDIVKHYSSAMTLLTRFDYQGDKAPTTTGSFAAASIATSSMQFVELQKTIVGVTAGDDLPSEQQNRLIHVLRRAMALCTAVGEQYDNFSGVSVLQQKIASNQYLTDEEKVLQGKLTATSTVIGVHVVSSYIIHALSAYATKSPIEAANPVINMSRPLNALKSILAGLNTNIKNIVKDDEMLVNIVVDYFEKVISENMRHVESLEHKQAYENNTFFIEADKFELNGFAKVGRTQTKKVEMKRIDPRDVVGNATAKYQCTKLAKAIMCYDFERRMNPFAELGGYIFTFMGDGNPGTGKTTLIQMLSTLLSDYCERLGVPYHYENFSTENISEYQGKSGQNAKAFINNVMNPDVIGFGTIDDIDQIAGKRGDNKASAGQQEVTAALMEAFAGATTVVRGNCVFGMFSNYPDKVDDALRQRAGARFLIDGPKTEEDFADLFEILLKGRSNIGYGDSEPFATQDIKKAAEKGFEKHALPHDAKLREAYDLTLEQLGRPMEFKTDFAKYCANIVAIDDRFTGRAINNICTAAKTRVTDIELPDEWFEDRTLFLDKPYDEKLAMIEAEAGEVSVEILMQELNRYADSEFRYANKSEEAEINDRVRSMNLHDKATEIYAEQKNVNFK